MRSNYKRLGNYIKLVEGRNTVLQTLPLMGLSITKKFIPSIANLVGTDMTTYRTIIKNQFAYSPVTSRNGDKITIALFDDYDKALISQAYTPFEVIDKTALLPEYLMMWFMRTEFDRYARFMSHGSARELFSWEDLCDLQMPIPSIAKQKEIVKEYNVIQNRIALNKQLKQKLEETAQAIYREWFVDFEFPDENGKGYKSAGGEMVKSELGEIPKGWEVDKLEKIILFKNGKTKPTKMGNIPVFGGNGIIEYVDKNNDENVIAIGRVGAYCGSLFRVLGKCWISDNAISAQSKINANMATYYILKSLKLNERSVGTGQPLITQGLLNGIRIPTPAIEIINYFEKLISQLFINQYLTHQENEKLEGLKNLLLSKLATIEN